MQLAKMNQPEDISVLMIEDSMGDAAAVAKAMMYEETLYNFHITHKKSLADAVHFLETLAIDVVLLDLNLPDADGLKSINEIHGLFPDVAIVVISGCSDMDMVHWALHSGVQDFLIKGECSGAVIRQSIYQAIVRKRIEKAYERGDRL